MRKGGVTLASTGTKYCAEGKRRVLRLDAVDSFAGIGRERGNVNQAGNVGCAGRGLGDHGASVRVTNHDRRLMKGRQVPFHRPDIIS
jgi:hypothetical protein